MQDTRSVTFMFALLVSFASVFGALFGGGATGSHTERPAAGVHNISTLEVAPPSGGVVASLDDTVELAFVQIARDQERAAEEAAAAAAAAAAAVEAERQRVAAEAEAAARRAIPVPVQNGCCGPHSDAWWRGVGMCEQGRNGQLYNDPYYGYFSFMDGSAGGKSWDEQVAMGNALLARVGREVPTWAQSCVNAGYAASPGG